MKTLRYAILFLFVAGCVGDPQDIPPGITEDPVFIAEFTLDDDAVLLQAGVDGYTLETTHETTNDGVVRYHTTFANHDCANSPCGPALEFVFWDNNTTSQPGSGVEATFVTGTKEFYDIANEDLLEVLISSQESAAPGALAVWTSAAGTVLSQGSSIAFTTQTDTMIDVCFSTLSDGNGAIARCQSSTCFQMSPLAPCVAWLEVERMINGHVLVETNVIGTPPISYQWMNGQTTPFILMPLYSDHPTGVSVVVRDANHCTAVIHQTMMLVDERPVLCAGAPNGFSVDIFDAPFSQFNSVEIRYTDVTGRVYSSGAAPQMQSNSFVIDGVQDYAMSPQGFPTKRIDGQASCALYAIDGHGSLELNLQSVVLAVSYSQ